MVSVKLGAGKRLNPNGNVKVVVRLRPLNEAEHNEKYHTVTHAISDHMLVFDPKVQNAPGILQAKPRDVNRHRYRDLKYAFDYVFGPYATNRDVFEHTTKSIVSGVLNGYNCSVFAYGATGAGKTHTMLGNENEPGVIYFTMMDLYNRIEEQKQQKVFDVAVSYSEVYNEQVRDLLMPRGNLPIREDKAVGVIIAGLSLHKPKSAEELLHMLQFGNKNRTQHPTDANAESSRSHAVFQVFVNQRDKLAKTGSEVVMAKMCLVDLAGSERALSTTNCGARFREGANINRSLLALGNVINALADNKFKGHIPYRDSKLTRLLKDSLGGNCKTVMIAAVSPSSRSFEDTYNTLRYADRAKLIRADVKQNVMSFDFHMANYKKYVQELEKQNQELKQTKQDLLDALEKNDSSCGQGISSNMRQFQERLRNLFQTRREIRKSQMESEGARRELKWKVSRREHAIKRVQQLTGSPKVQNKHRRVIERMKKLVDKEEQALKDSNAHIQEQDKAISQAIAEFAASDSRQISEQFDLFVRMHIAESNLYDSDMYLAFVKKLARAQERQVSTTEILLSSLLQLVKRQQDALHSHDLLNPELQTMFEQCCYLVEERGVAFPQQQKPSKVGSPSQNGGGNGLCDSGDGGVPSPSDLAAAKPIEDNSNVSEIIDIHIPRLKAQSLIERITQAKPQGPQRILKPVSAVKPAARINSVQTQENECITPASSLPQPIPRPGLVSQGTFSKSPAIVPSAPSPVGQATGTNPTNPIDLLNLSLEACQRLKGRNLNCQISTSESLQTGKPAPESVKGKEKGTLQSVSVASMSHTVQKHSTNDTHHRFQQCGSASSLDPLSKGQKPHLPQQAQSLQFSTDLGFRTSQHAVCVVRSPELNSSTENLNNTFQVLQPALPNTPCIDNGPRREIKFKNHNDTFSVPQLIPSNATHLNKPSVALPSHHHICPPPTVSGGNHQSLDSNKQQLPRSSNSFHSFVSGDANWNSSSIDSNKGDQQPLPSSSLTERCFEQSMVVRPIPHQGSNLAVTNVSKLNASSTQENTNNSNSSSPKSYAEALKSPPVCRTPSSVQKPPVRVLLTPRDKKVTEAMTMKTPDFSLCQVKQRLLFTNEKTSSKTENDNNKATEKTSDSQKGCNAVIRQPLRQMDTNSKNKQLNVNIPKSTSSTLLKVNTVSISSKDSEIHLPDSGSHLQLKARPAKLRERRFQRIHAASSPYSTCSPRRAARRHPSHKDNDGTDIPLKTPGSGDTNSQAPSDRPNYMQTTFSRAQKKKDTSAPQRQLINPSQSKPTIIHKQRFFLA